VHPEQIRRFRRRAATAWELRRHPDRIRLPLLAFWCGARQAEVIDGLVELRMAASCYLTVGFDQADVRRRCAKALLPPIQGPRRALNVPSWRWRRSGAGPTICAAGWMFMRGDLEQVQKQAMETVRQAVREGLRRTRGLVALFQTAWRGDWGAIGR